MFLRLPVFHFPSFLFFLLFPYYLYLSYFLILRAALLFSKFLSPLLVDGWLPRDDLTLAEADLGAGRDVPPEARTQASALCPCSLASWFLWA